MIRVRSNISEFIREMGVLTRGKNSIYRKAGSQLRQTILDEFEVLVRETPQYSGTTAASWKLGHLYAVDPGKVVLPKPASVADALQRGAEPACHIAINNARGQLAPDLRDYARKDIVLHNESPGFDTAEEGPVRAVNTPPGALKRFEGRINTMYIEVDFYKT